MDGRTHPKARWPWILAVATLVLLPASLLSVQVRLTLYKAGLRTQISWLQPWIISRARAEGMAGYPLYAHFSIEGDSDDGTMEWSEAIVQAKNIRALAGFLSSAQAELRQTAVHDVGVLLVGTEHVPADPIPDRFLSDVEFARERMRRVVFNDSSPELREEAARILMKDERGAAPLLLEMLNNNIEPELLEAAIEQLLDRFDLALEERLEEAESPEQRRPMKRTQNAHFLKDAPTLLPALLAQLSAPESEAREVAMELLERFAEEALRSLFASLRSLEAEERSWAAQRLGEAARASLGSSEDSEEGEAALSFTPLLTFCRGAAGDPARVPAIRALVSLDYEAGESLVPLLLKELEDGPAPGRKTALLSLEVLLPEVEDQDAVIGALKKQVAIGGDLGAEARRVIREHE